MKQALALAVEHYQRLRDEAAAELQQAQQQLAALRQTLATLEHYHAEQQQRRRSAASSSRRITALQRESRFAGTIGQAIEQQQLLVQQALPRVEQKRLILLDCQKRLKAVELILRQRAQRLAWQAARQERLATDEQAALKHLQQRRALQPDPHSNFENDGMMS